MMNHFLIQFLPGSATSDTALGLITVGDFQERFSASRSCWLEADYQHHWLENIRKIVSGESTAALIASMARPSEADFLIWWPLYRVGQMVYIQNHILFFDLLESEFDDHDPYRHIPPRCTVTEEGDKISEWTVGVADLEYFLNQPSFVWQVRQKYSQFVIA